MYTVTDASAWRYARPPLRRDSHRAAETGRRENRLEIRQAFADKTRSTARKSSSGLRTARDGGAPGLLQGMRNMARLRTNALVGTPLVAALVVAGSFLVRSPAQPPPAPPPAEPERSLMQQTDEEALA